MGSAKTAIAELDRTKDQLLNASVPIMRQQRLADIESALLNIVEDELLSDEDRAYAKERCLPGSQISARQVDVSAGR